MKRASIAWNATIFALESSINRSTPGTEIKTNRVTLVSIWFAILITYRPHIKLPNRDLLAHRRLLKKLRGTLLDLFAPELLLYDAIEDLQQARNLKKKMRNCGHYDWTLTHSFYSNMGGLLCLDERGTWVRCDINDDIIRAAVRWSSIPPAAVIRDMSSSRLLDNACLIIQALWNILTVCGRLAQNLGISQLEIATVIYSIVFLLTYAIWWQKPNDPTPWHLSWNSVAGERRAALERLNQSRRSSQTPPNQKLWMLPLASAIFSSAYGTSPSHVFPTKIEQTLWKASVLLPTIVAAVTAIYLRTAYRPKCFLRSGRLVERTIGRVCLGLYGACRLFILCEGFMACRWQSLYTLKPLMPTT
jgi:hypothetical protein